VTRSPPLQIIPHRTPVHEPARPGTCRLVLQIRGRNYALRPLDNQMCPGYRAWALRKPDPERTTYNVADTPHGAVCDCASFTFKHDGRDAVGCKHIRALRACHLIDRSAQAPPPSPLIGRETAERIASLTLVGHMA